jgi:hypothetical protein
MTALKSAGCAKIFAEKQSGVVTGRKLACSGGETGARSGGANLTGVNATESSTVKNANSGGCGRGERGAQGGEDQAQ